jgi:hypothetical protein
LAQGAEDLRARPGGFDRTVSEFVREVARRAAERVAIELGRRAITAARDDGFVIERSPRIEVTTLFGKIEIKSPYMRRGTQGCRPVNETLGVHGRGMTLALERALCDFGVDESFEKAAAKLKEHYGMEIGRTTVLRVVTKHGQDADLQARFKAMDARFSRAPTGGSEVRMLAEMDGSSVRTGELQPSNTGAITPKRGLPKRKRETHWRDFRLAFVRPLDDQGGQTTEPLFVGGIHDFEEITARALAEAHGLGWTESTFTVRVTDGGHGLREALDAVFPTGQAVLDRPHLMHHLHEAAQARLGEGPAAQGQVDTWAARIGAGHVSDVIQDLRSTPPTATGADRSQQLANYLARFADAVHYDAYLRQGLPIGSGEIESAHKGQVQARLKLPGTWWTVDHANRVVALRLLRTNGRWGAYWDQRAA